MIITADEIRKVRPVAQNISDTIRIEPYIQEVAEMFVIPQLGAKIYKAIEEGTAPWIEELKQGGYYDDDTAYFAGLTSAVAYLAYSRMIRNQSVNVTAFGVVRKNGELSEQLDEATIARMSNEALDIGVRNLQGCVEFLKYKCIIACSTTRVTKAKIKVF